MSAPDPIVAANWPEVAAWLDRARRDSQAAALCISSQPPLPDVASFHCQQAAEKLLKGLLVLAGKPAPRTHDLIRLADAVAAAFPALAELAHATEGWSVWNTAYRYPSEDVAEPPPSAEELSQALRLIERLAAALNAMRPINR